MLALMAREWACYWRTPQGYLIVAATLFVDGLLFHTFAIGQAPRPCGEVLEHFFYLASGTTLVASLMIAMRTIAEERAHQTLVLLRCSALSEVQIVCAKFAAAYAFLAALTLATAYIPASLLMRGNIALGHLAAGYLGLLLLGSAALAVGMLASAVAANQLMAAVFGAAGLGVLISLWRLARIASPPFAALLAYLSLHERHFVPFMRGIVSSSDVVFYLSFTGVALVATTGALRAQRWH